MGQVGRTDGRTERNHAPTRNLLRHGSRSAFQPSHSLRKGDVRFEAICGEGDVYLVIPHGCLVGTYCRLLRGSVLRENDRDVVGWRGDGVERPGRLAPPLQIFGGGADAPATTSRLWLVQRAGRTSFDREYWNCLCAPFPFQFRGTPLIN